MQFPTLSQLLIDFAARGLVYQATHDTDEMARADLERLIPTFPASPREIGMGYDSWHGYLANGSIAELISQIRHGTEGRQWDPLVAVLIYSEHAVMLQIYSPRVEAFAVAHSGAR